MNMNDEVNPPPGEAPTAQQPRRSAIARLVSVLDRVVAPLALFVSFYLAAFMALLWSRALPVQWSAAIAVIVATAFTILIWERRRWPLGLTAPPLTALRELGGGMLFACLLIGAADLLIIATTDFFHRAGNGFPWGELLLVYVPAVLHEELLFRGYAFQKLRVWHRLPAILLTSLLFMVLHMGNDAVTPLALTNIFLGGVLLALAYERRESLLFPIGLHFAWNLASGPILGYQVSGYVSAVSLLITDGSGRPELTGGAFGIEGSIFMTLVECVAIAVLWRMNLGIARRRQNSAVAAGVPHLNSDSSI
jgi:membrane protease YdiL (CAAX protease family)